MGQAKPLTKIRLATSTAVWTSRDLAAQRKGYFKEEGIDFEHILTTAERHHGRGHERRCSIRFHAASDVLVARSRGDRMFSVGIFPASLEWHIATSNNGWKAAD